MIQILLNTYNLTDNWCYPILKTKIKPQSKVAILAFSFHDADIKNKEEWNQYYNKDSGRYYNSIVHPLLSFGLKEEEITWVNYFSDTKEEAKKKLTDSDIIYLTGGLPDRMMERIVEFDLVDLLEQYNGILLGCSAGSMIQVKEYHITPDGDYLDYSYQKGLNLIHNFDIEVHFKGSYVQEDCIKKAIDEKKKDIYAIEDDGGLIIEDGCITCIGKVHIYRALKTKMLMRLDWHRVLQKEFTSLAVNNDLFCGEAGLIQIKKIKKPLIVKAGEEYINVADIGYYWLQFAPSNKNYWLTVMYNSKEEIVQYYFDISYKNVVRDDGNSFFYDLYLDVVVVPNGNIYIIDEDELQEAYDNHTISRKEYELANETAFALKNKLIGKEKELRDFCMGYFELLKADLQKIN